MKCRVSLYEKASGDCPVLDFFRSLSPKHQAKIYREIDLLEEFGSDLHFPHVRKIEGKRYKPLWELRIKLASDAFRILYFIIHTDEYILLNSFIKKTNKTPINELAIALNRMKDLLQRVDQ